MDRSPRNHLRFLQDTVGLSQDRLGSKVGRDRSKVSRYLSGELPDDPDFETRLMSAMADGPELPFVEASRHAPQPGRDADCALARPRRPCADRESHRSRRWRPRSLARAGGPRRGPTQVAGARHRPAPVHPGDFVKKAARSTSTAVPQLRSIS